MAGNHSKSGLAQTPEIRPQLSTRPTYQFPGRTSEAATGYRGRIFERGVGGGIITGNSTQDGVAGWTALSCSALVVFGAMLYQFGYLGQEAVHKDSVSEVGVNGLMMVRIEDNLAV